MDKKILTLPISILLASIIIGGFYYASEVNNKRLLRQQAQEQDSSSKAKSVKLFYNKSTGELYPILPDDFKPHTCVWTISGDHGSDMKLTTDRTFISNETDPDIKSNKFLPPRVPIYVTCVDWQNQVYQAALGEY